ncbi:MAG: hypothetical protein ACO25F_11720, partial [Erythrobacter sp.]
WLKVRGYVFSAAAQAEIPGLLGERADEAKTLLLQDVTVIGSSEVVATVPAEAGLVETVLAPGPSGIFIATSLSERELFISDPDGRWINAPIRNGSDLSGIVTDPARDIGWVASANIDGSEEKEQSFIGLIGLTGDINDLKYVPAPEGVALSDLALGPDGTVYASDPLGGGIYFASPGAERLEALLEPGTLRSPQGLAVSEDGQRLYVSDYRYGIAMVDLASRKVTRLAADVPALLDGIDGLWRHGNELIAVQNGTSPIRISAFALSGDGTRVSGHRVLEQANPDWTEPLGGSIAGDALFYVGNGQWDRFEKGQPVAGKPALPTQIRKLPLTR